MATSVSTHQRGFTLIEMSIVLVIIGLIVGGILKGQELIESSRQKNLMSQIDHLKADTTTFVDRFRSLPGDFRQIQRLPNSGTLVSGGNDDGIIGTPTSTVALLITLTNVNKITAENEQYFNQLLAAGMGSNGTVTANTVTTACFSGLCNTASPLPNSSFPASGLTIGYGSHEGGTNANGNVVTATALWGHFYILSRFATAALTSNEGVMSPTHAFQLDNKFDDGGAGSGNIRSTFVGNGCGDATHDYSTTGTATECSLVFAVQ